VRTDGLKLILDDGSWFATVFQNRTVVRAYTESAASGTWKALSAAAEKFVLS